MDAPISVKVPYINRVPGRNGRKYYYCRLTGVAPPSPDDKMAFLAAVLTARAHLEPDPTPASVRLPSYEGFIVKQECHLMAKIVAIPEVRRGRPSFLSSFRDAEEVMRAWRGPMCGHRG